MVGSDEEGGGDDDDDDEEGLWVGGGGESPSFCVSRGRALKFKQVPSVLLLHARTKAALFAVWRGQLPPLA